jgi:ferric iron reductase protein FhuF
LGDQPLAADRDEVARALRWAGEISPLFALESGPAEGRASAASWRSATALCSAGSPDVARLVADVGAALGATERRVAASLVLLGYSARLVAPAVAVLLHDGLLLDVRPEAVQWRYAPGEGFRLRMPVPAGRRLSGSGPTGEGAAQHWCHEVVDGHLRPVVAAVRQAAPVAAGLLWGNVASSLAGALRTLALAGAAPADACAAAGQALLGTRSLRGTGELSTRGGELRFVRRSCCLYYRLPGGGWCGDCPLRKGP